MYFRFSTEILLKIYILLSNIFIHILDRGGGDEQDMLNVVMWEAS